MSSSSNNTPPKGGKRSGLAVLTLVAGVALLIVGWIYANNGPLFNGFGNEGGEDGKLAANSCPIANQVGSAVDAAATGEVAAFQVVDEPADISNQTFVDRDGKPRSLKDWTGKTVLLNLWATWCAPCREEMPYLDQLQADMGGDAFDVVAVSVDLGEPDKPKAFYEEIAIQHLPFYADNTMDIFNNLKKSGLAFGMPTTVLITSDGCAVGVLNGPAHWATEDAKAMIRAGMPE